MRPWYRSRFLWLGLPGLLFLLWLCLPGAGFTLTWVRAGDEFELAVGSGTIRGTYERYMVPRFSPFGTFWLRPTGFYMKPHANSAEADFCFPEAVRVEGIRGGTWANWIIVAVWALMPLYLLAWLGLFSLVQRRKARLLAALIDNP